MTTANTEKVIMEMTNELSKEIPGLSLSGTTVVRDKMTIADESNAVEVYEIGPNPHAAEMLIIYHPSSGTLYVADVFDIQEGIVPSASDDTFAFANSLKRLGLKVNRIIPAHGRPGSLNDLKQSLKPAR